MWTHTSVLFRHHIQKNSLSMWSLTEPYRTVNLARFQFGEFSPGFSRCWAQGAHQQTAVVLQGSPQVWADFQQPAQALVWGSGGTLGRSMALPFGSVWWEEMSACPPGQRNLQRAAADARYDEAVLCCALTLHQTAVWFPDSTDLGFNLGFIYTQPPYSLQDWLGLVNWGFAAQENGTWLPAGNLSAAMHSALSKDAE